MTRESVLILAAALMLTLTGTATAQQPEPPTPESDTDPTEPTRYRGFLPQNWGQIGLSDAQKQEIYKRQAKYQGQIKALELKIAALRSQERRSLYDVLTDEQKDKLRSIILEKISNPKPVPAKSKE